MMRSESFGIGGNSIGAPGATPNYSVMFDRENTANRMKWWPGRELNPRHADFQSAALPTELPGLLSRVLDRPVTYTSTTPYKS